MVSSHIAHSAIVSSSHGDDYNASTKYFIKINQCNALETKAETLQCLQQVEKEFYESQKNEACIFIGFIIVFTIGLASAIKWIG